MRRVDTPHPIAIGCVRPRVSRFTPHSIKLSRKPSYAAPALHIGLGEQDLVALDGCPGQGGETINRVEMIDAHLHQREGGRGAGFTQPLHLSPMAG